MNNPPTMTDYLVIGTLLGLGILFLALFIWFNFFRKKKKVLARTDDIDEDSAYNALLQARSIVKMFKEKGADTTRSEKILMEAEKELERNHYTTAVALARSAKSIARGGTGAAGGPGDEGMTATKEYIPSKEIIAKKEFVAKPKSAVPVKRPAAKTGIGMPGRLEKRPGSRKPSGETEGPVEFAYYKTERVTPPPDKTEELLKDMSRTASGEELPEESESFAFRKKMPENYMEAKFKLELARQAVTEAQAAGRDAGQADEQLLQAKSQFDSENYAAALSSAIKAEKMARGIPLDSGIKEITKPPPDTPTAIVDRAKPEAPRRAIAATVQAVPPSKPSATAVTASSVLQTGPDTVPGATQSLNCNSCGKGVLPDDNFCRKCGTKVEKPLNCPSCTVDLEKDDIFCRKCGAKVDHITQQ
jgi:hypothetical protein